MVTWYQDELQNTSLECTYAPLALYGMLSKIMLGEWNQPTLPRENLANDTTYVGPSDLYSQIYLVHFFVITYMLFPN